MAGAATAPQTTINEKLYRIGEVSRMTELKPFVLRYWETEFPMLEPVKSSSGHRLYRAQDVDMVLKIKRLLYDEGFTIAGARRHLRDPNAVAEQQLPPDFQLAGTDARDVFRGDARSELRGDVRSETPAPLLNRKMLLDLRDSLRAFLTLLERR
jgi:DNA-binding transcriptional MerR regulator